VAGVANEDALCDKFELEGFVLGIVGASAGSVQVARADVLMVMM